MVLEYFTLKRDHKEKHGEPAKSPVLNEEDERFLSRVASEATPPPLPERPSVILDNGKEFKADGSTAGADQIPLPTSPPVEDEKKDIARAADAKHGRKWNYSAYLPAIPMRTSAKNKDRAQFASDLHSAAESLKAGGEPNVTAEQANKEEDDLISVLDQLNLSAVNNRVFSFSKESQDLMEKFTLVLKDIINGVPTAYDDLETLLTRSEGQLNSMFSGMPPFLQTLVKSLPSKMTTSIAPELLAAAAEKPGVKAQGTQESSKEGEKKKKKTRIPSLKTMVSEQGAVATMLRSILNFLKLRFPAFITGTNVLMSLALFLLLLVFWYCHKRGRETRLSRESASASSPSAAADTKLSDSDIEVTDLDESVILEKPAEKEPGDDEERPRPGEESSTIDLPSVLDLPDPKTVPLHDAAAKDENDRAKDVPLQAERKV